MNPTSKNQAAKRYSWFLRAGLGIGMLAVVLNYVDLQRFGSTLGALSPDYLAAIVAVALVGRFLRAWKWAVLLRAKGMKVSTWQALCMSWISHFAGSWTPGQIGGDAYRWYALRDYRKSKDVLSTLLLERYAGICSVAFYVIVGLPFTLPYLLRVSWWLVPLLGFLTLVLAILPCLASQRAIDGLVRWIPALRHTPLEGKFRSFYQSISDYRKHPRLLLGFSLAAIAEAFSYFMLNYLTAQALGLDVSWIYFLMAMPVVHLLLRIPLSVQSLGIQEGCFVYALTLHGFQPAEGLAVSVALRVLEWVLAILPGGMLFAFTSGPALSISSSQNDTRANSPTP